MKHFEHDFLKQRQSLAVTSRSKKEIKTQPGEIAERLKSSLASLDIPEERMNSLIARTCDITYQSVFNWFNGKTQIPRADHLARIAMEYEIDPHWLILGKESKRHA